MVVTVVLVAVFVVTVVVAGGVADGTVKACLRVLVPTPVVQACRWSVPVASTTAPFPTRVHAVGRVPFVPKSPPDCKDTVEVDDGTVVGPVVVTVGPEFKSMTGPESMLIALVSLSVLLPPEPVLPPSLVSMVKVADEVDEKVGAVASRKALMLATLPLNTNEPVPLPVTVTPPPDVAASVPMLTLKVVVITPATAASTSETARPDNTTGALLLPTNVVGRVLTGASLAAAKVMVLVSTSVLMPPVPMLPPSLVVMVSTTSPLKLLTGK